MFKNIKTFEWKDLSGKTLEIKANESVDGLIVIARDIKTNDIYVLENKPVIEKR
jgi:hypothetical protein